MFPKIDLQHKEDTLTYEIVVPGFSKEDIDLFIRGKTILLEGKNGRTKEVDYVNKLSTPKEFSISIPLPLNGKLAEDNIKLINGILKVPIKLDERKKITIQ